MELKWASEARDSFRSIKSKHFSRPETIEYKKQLSIKIRNKIVTMMDLCQQMNKNGKETIGFLLTISKCFIHFLMISVHVISKDLNIKSKIIISFPFTPNFFEYINTLRLE